MKNIEVVFSMTSLDSKDSFTTIGEIKGNRIIFEDSEENKHYVIINNESIEYYKRGSMKMKYVFNLKHNTIGTYEIDSSRFEFIIKTKILDIEDNQIIIEYDLLLNDELVNQSTLLIKYS